MIRFIVHGGYGKTATSFLQEKIFMELDDVLYLGKEPDGSMISDELKEHYHALFPFISQKKFQKLRARNSSLMIAEIGDLILEEIRRCNQEIVLLSDECIIDFMNYKAELNQLILMRLFTYLQENSDQDIEFQIMMAIRNQKDVLKSSYAYGYSLLKDRFENFEAFIRYGAENPAEIAFGGYFYDLVLKDLKDLFGEDNVQFFVYERMKKELKAYLGDILEFVGTDHNLDSLDYQTVVNKNSQGDSHTVRELKFSTGASIAKRAYRAVKPALEPLEKIPIVKKLKKKAQKAADDSIQVVKAGELKDIPEEVQQTIDEMYAESNTNLSEMLDEDLEQYGYVTSKP